MTGNGILSSKSNRKDNKIEHNFLTICRYLNLVKNSHDFIATRKFTRYYNIKICTVYRKNTCYFHWICMKLDLLLSLKNNSYENV